VRGSRKNSPSVSLREPPPRASSGRNCVRLFLPELVSGRGTAPHRGVVEGEPRTTGRDDSVYRPVRVPQHVAGRDAQGRDPLSKKPGVSDRIVARLSRLIVDSAVDLDREPRVAAVEIQDVRTTGMLPAKLEALRTAAKCTPKQAFRQSQLPSQTSSLFNSAVARFRRHVSQHRRSPSTILRTVPLPEASSGRTLLCGGGEGMGVKL